MKHYRLLICFLAASLCLSACSGKDAKTDSTTTDSTTSAIASDSSSDTTADTSESTTEEVPLGGNEISLVMDGTQNIGAMGTPYDDETIKERLTDPILIRDCNETFGEDYHFAEYGCYMIDLEEQKVDYEFMSFPIIKNDVIVGFVKIWGGSVTFGYDPVLLDPEYPHDPSGTSYTATINTLLKENPDERFVWLCGGGAEFFLDSKNEIHPLMSYGMDDLTILNPDTLYTNYCIEGCTISADVIS